MLCIQHQALEFKPLVQVLKKIWYLRDCLITDYAFINVHIWVFFLLPEGSITMLFKHLHFFPPDQ